MDTIDEHNFERWLTEDRAISLAVANAAGVELVKNAFGEEVKIPIKDPDGTIFFNKYRRSPWSDSGTKYRYDRGSHAQIFGAEFLSEFEDSATVVMTEGELDALALRTAGYKAISSTGGAGTFRPEWNDTLSRFDLVLLYDADKAGIEGMLRVVSKAPHARIAWLPVEYGKDVTDVLIAEGDGDSALHNAIESAKHYYLPTLESSPKERIAAYKIVLDAFFAERLAILNDPEATPFHRDIAITYVEHEMKKAKDELTASAQAPRPKLAGPDMDRARAHPLHELVKVNRLGFAPCVYHEEKSASMKIYRDNHAFSYCCSKRSDAIDIYQALNPGTSFKEAVAKLI